MVKLSPPDGIAEDLKTEGRPDDDDIEADIFGNHSRLHQEMISGSGDPRLLPAPGGFSRLKAVRLRATDLDENEIAATGHDQVDLAVKQHNDGGLADGSIDRRTP